MWNPEAGKWGGPNKNKNSGKEKYGIERDFRIGLDKNWLPTLCQHLKIAMTKLHCVHTGNSQNIGK